MRRHDGTAIIKPAVVGRSRSAFDGEQPLDAVLALPLADIDIDGDELLHRVVVGGELQQRIERRQVTAKPHRVTSDATSEPVTIIVGGGVHDRHARSERSRHPARRSRRRSQPAACRAASRSGGSCPSPNPRRLKSALSGLATEHRFGKGVAVGCRGRPRGRRSTEIGRKAALAAATRDPPFLAQLSGFAAGRPRPAETLRAYSGSGRRGRVPASQFSPLTAVPSRRGAVPRA